MRRALAALALSVFCFQGLESGRPSGPFASMTAAISPNCQTSPVTRFSSCRVLGCKLALLSLSGHFDDMRMSTASHYGHLLCNA